MMKSEMLERMMDECRGIYQMQGENIEPCWEEERRTCYLTDEYVDRTTMELTSGEAVVFQKFPVELLERYGMVSGNIERRGGGYQISYDKKMFVSLRIPQDIAEHMDALKVQRG